MYPVLGAIDRGHAPPAEFGQEVVSVGQGLPYQVRHRSPRCAEAEPRPPRDADTAPGDLAALDSVVLEYQGQEKMLHFPKVRAAVALSNVRIALLIQVSPRLCVVINQIELDEVEHPAHPILPDSLTIKVQLDCLLAFVQ